jgi:hypothetical protein
MYPSDELAVALYACNNNLQATKHTSFFSLYRDTHTPTFDAIKGQVIMVRDDPQLLDDDGEIPKPQGSGWWFDF